MSRSQSASDVLEVAHVPDTAASDVRHVVEVSQPTANRLLRDLSDIGLLSEITGKQRNQQWVYGEYLRLFRPNDT